MAFESVQIKNEARPNDRVYAAASAPDNEIVAPDGWDGVVSLWKWKSGFKSRALVLAPDPNAAIFTTDRRASHLADTRFASWTLHAAAREWRVLPCKFRFIRTTTSKGRKNW